MEDFKYLIILLAISVGTWFLAKKRGRNPWRWVFASIVFSFLPLIYLLCTGPIKGASGPTQSGSSSGGGKLSGKAFHDALKELRGVGEKTAWAVIDVYPSSDDLVGVTIDELKSIDGISPANAEVIKHHFG